MADRTYTTKDIALLKQLYDGGQLILAPEFQRNNIWPHAAKAYLIDTILNDRPIPLIFLQKITSAQTGRPSYSVIDGQQRLRAVFEFLEDRFKLTESASNQLRNKRFSGLTDDLRQKVYNYTFVVQELSGYGRADIRDMFVRMNKYLVKLSRQELRHAKADGAFHKFVERIGKWNFWHNSKIFSQSQINRMRAIEFAAEIVILLIEGPQDKKASIDLYYGQYKDRVPQAKTIESLLHNYLDWIKGVLPNLATTIYRSPVDLYSLLGALDLLRQKGENVQKINKTKVGNALMDFQDKTRASMPTGDAARYKAAASRQTDNIIPRRTRIEILMGVMKTG
jgi:hypothetical protein